MAVTAEQQVVIVGAGPVGALCALGLAQRGIEVTVLEKHHTVWTSPRAMVYHWSLLEGLEQMGLLSVMADKGILKQDYGYFVPSTGEFISFGLWVLDDLVRHPYNLHLGQDEFVRMALEKLAEFPNARVVWNAEVTAIEQNQTAVTVTASTGSGAADERFRAQWLIGADGARSLVRKSQALDFEGMTWPVRFVATNIRFPFSDLGWPRSGFAVDDVHGAVVAQIDDSEPGGLWRFTYAEPENLPVEGIRERIPFYLSGSTAHEVDDVEVESFSPYRLHQRSATAYRSGRVLLAGDSAHATNPTGGLGLTSGMYDTYLLVDVLSAVLDGRADALALDWYSQDRRRVFTEIVSPAAIRNKKVVYETPKDELEEALAPLRRLATDDAVARERLMFPASLQSPAFEA